MARGVKANAVHVDCLRPGAVKKPHKFWSRESGNRVCKACRKMQDAKPVPPLLLKPIEFPSSWE